MITELASLVYRLWSEADWREPRLFGVASWLKLLVSSLTGVLKLHWINASLRSLTLQYLSVMNFLPFSDAQSSYAPFIKRLGSLAFWRGTFL